MPHAWKYVSDHGSPHTLHLMALCPMPWSWTLQEKMKYHFACTHSVGDMKNSTYTNIHSICFGFVEIRLVHFNGVFELAVQLSSIWCPRLLISFELGRFKIDCLCARGHFATCNKFVALMRFRTVPVAKDCRLREQESHSLLSWPCLLCKTAWGADSRLQMCVLVARVQCSWQIALL